MWPIIDEEAETTSVADGDMRLRWVATASGWTYNMGRVLAK
jgi:hypothetical protein